MINPNYSSFLFDLSMNNERDWFQNNKKRYEKEAKQPFINLVELLIERLQNSTEPDLIVDPKRCLFRINRDIRFSKDKRPYKEYLSAVVSKFGTSNKIFPSHYVQMEADKAFLAGGAYWFEEKEMLRNVRYYIIENAERFADLHQAADFKKYWGGIVGEKNKRLPTDLADFAKREPLVANTQFFWQTNLAHEQVADLKSLEDWADFLTPYFHAAKPLNDFLIEAMYGVDSVD